MTHRTTVVALAGLLLAGSSASLAAQDVASMEPGHRHMSFTPPRAGAPADSAKALAVVHSLRAAIAQYSTLAAARPRLTRWEGFLAFPQDKATESSSAGGYSPAMASPMSTLPPADRPRERLWALGPAALTTAELLAIVIGTGRGRRGVLEVAGGLLELSEGSLRRLSQRPRSEWLRAEGIGPTKAARLAAAFELGSRLAREERPPLQRIREPEDVARRFSNRLRDLQVEEFHLLALDSQSQVLREVLITRGLLNSSLVHPREVFRAAIVEAAAGIIVVHNHPSGDPTPSAEDRAVTRQLAEAGRLLDLPLYDHVIIAGDRYLSLATAGLL